jgi:hypothetical protein
MRMPIRNTFDLCLAGVATVLGMVLDASLLSLFKAHFSRTPAFNRYHPVYLRSGRRNRNRY